MEEKCAGHAVASVSDLLNNGFASTVRELMGWADINVNTDVLVPYEYFEERRWVYLRDSKGRHGRSELRDSRRDAQMLLDDKGRH